MSNTSNPLDIGGEIVRCDLYNLEIFRRRNDIGRYSAFDQLEITGPICTAHPDCFG